MKHPRQRPTPKQRREVFRKWRGCCAYCGKSVGAKWHVDHVKPVARGGRTEMSNLVLACPSCNLKKGTKNWKPRDYEMREAVLVAFILGLFVFLSSIMVIAVLFAL